MGPSVKLVSPNKGLISKKKMGVNFFLKKDHTRVGRGVQGGFGKRPHFFTFFWNHSLISIDQNEKHLAMMTSSSLLIKAT